MANLLGRKSIIQIELTGKLPHDQPGYLTAHEWDLISLHVKDGDTLGSIAAMEGVPMANLRKQMTRIGSLVARSLELPNSQLAKEPITATKSCAPRRRQVIETVIPPASPRAVMPVRLISKTETLDDCRLDVEDSEGRRVAFAGLECSAAASFAVGRTYNLYLG